MAHKSQFSGKKRLIIDPKSELKPAYQTQSNVNIAIVLATIVPLLLILMLILIDQLPYLGTDKVFYDSKRDARCILSTIKLQFSCP